MRQLVTIQTVDNLIPIPNADNIEIAHVLGWQVVVKKGEFKIGDKCIYFEIDSVVPPLPEYEFLAARRYRVKTIRLRGELSQGLCLPVPSEMASLDVGEDVTERMGVVKYDPPEISEGDGCSEKTRGGFPSHLVSKTDEIRLQSKKRFLEEFNGVLVYSSVKCDGTSATFVMEDEELLVCSRNRAVKESENSKYWKMVYKYKINDILSEYPNYAIQGEICGPGIQENKLGLKELDLFVFNIKDIVKNRYLNYHDLILFCTENALNTVPIDNVFVLSHTLAELLEMARGKYPSGRHREGIVIRPIVETYSETLRGRASIKVINNDFLLREK